MRASGGEQQGQMVETREGRVFQKVLQGQSLVCASGNGARKEIRSVTKVLLVVFRS